MGECFFYRNNKHFPLKSNTLFPPYKMTVFKGKLVIIFSPRKTQNKGASYYEAVQNAKCFYADRIRHLDAN